MLSLWFIAVVIGVVAAIAAPFKLRSTLRGRLRAGSRTIEHRALVTVVGTIRETDTLVDSPISTKRGVVVHAQAELPEMGPDGPVILKTRRMTPFELDTMHGVILVDGTEVDIVMKLPTVAKRSPNLERAFVIAHGRGETIANVATFRELVLGPGARITVHGVAMVEDQIDAERGYRDAAPTRTRIVAAEKYPITIGEWTDRY